MNIVVIPDAHVSPGQDLTRFASLGRCIAQYAEGSQVPVAVVCLGDWWDMKSLCSYDKGTASFEGRRYNEDIQAGQAAMRLMMDQVPPALRRSIEWHFCLGNHEQRIARAANAKPEFTGLLSLDALGLEELGWTVHPFLTPVVLGGVAFAHYFTSGVMGRPVGGVKPAQALAVKLHHSAVVGHTHVLDTYRTATALGAVNCLVAGCFFDHREEWAGPANDMYWRGLVLLHNVRDGDYDLTTVSTRRLAQMFPAG